MADDSILDEVADELDYLETRPEPTIQSLLDKRSLKWIFVGGKGGVGKTTTSSTIATLLAKVRESVLLISTDPAHNLSDAFGQKFTRTPTLVNGFDNLYAMEVDPTIETEESLQQEIFGQDAQLGSFLKEMLGSIPGIDEAMSFAEVMKLVSNMKFETVVFDTAPTGHTLRLLSFPSLLEKGFGKIMSIKNKMGGMFNQLSGMLSSTMGLPAPEQMEDKLETTKKLIAEIHKQFTNPDLTTFVCVCIPEFLSLYETERLVQELGKYEIDVGHIIINQVLYPDKGSSCELCLARQKMQQKYIDQIVDLYEDFHVIKVPLQKEEVRGREKLEAFAKFLLHPYDVEYAALPSSAASIP